MGPTPPLSSHERIHDGPDITVVDLEDCSAREAGSVYRVLTIRLTRGELRGVLVKSGQRSPEGHRALSDALRGIALRVFDEEGEALAWLALEA